MFHRQANSQCATGTKDKVVLAVEPNYLES